jgi:hypothetical protein
MLRKLAGHVRHNVIAYLALFVALGGTSAYAADTIGSDDIIDESILSQDVKNGEVKTSELANGAVSTAKLGANAVTSPTVRDFGLRNEDIGVLFAEVTSTPSTVTVSNSSGGVTATRIGATPNNGLYSVDFGRNITDCTAVATIGRSDTTMSLGEVYVADRAGNVEAVSVRTSSSNGTAGDRPFRLVVVC